VIRAVKRDQLQQYLQKKGIATGLHYPVPLHLQEAYLFLNQGKGSFPIAESITSELVSLPMFPELTKKQMEHVVTELRNFLYCS
jgi:dTDP-4-amino-4,6-dideoxygalactose transaminase